MHKDIVVSNLTKKYGSLIAVNNISFSIENGKIFGILGPNGAGKTTAVEMMESLRKPDNGTVEIKDIDIISYPDKVKEIIGVQLQSTSLYGKIKVREAIELFGSYYKKSIPVDEIINIVSLNEKKDSYYATLSGGQKQRLALALAIVNDPQIIFLDEPTTGLDPQARRNVWDIIENLKNKAKTIILTTHYMEEAERLCDEIAIMDMGEIIAMGSPKELISNSRLESSIEFECTGNDYDKINNGLNFLGKIIKLENNRCAIYCKDNAYALKKLTDFTDSNEISIKNINTRSATLEDVFISLTGKSLRE
ncbi:MAG: ABC transporter ATP-binding protein [Actinomycetota bacterium]|nr:ABC transporter ATP-binding protein [Actinomycetota bacterium]